MADVLFKSKSSYLGEGIEWVCSIIKTAKDMNTIDLGVNTILNLDKFIAQCIDRNRSRISETLELRDQVFYILDFLIDNNSPSAFSVREELL
jgi:O-phosphoseryl-tRNA(Cys) synthetase